MGINPQVPENSDDGPEQTCCRIISEMASIRPVKGSSTLNKLGRKGKFPIWGGKRIPL